MTQVKENINFNGTRKRKTKCNGIGKRQDKI